MEQLPGNRRHSHRSSLSDAERDLRSLRSAQGDRSAEISRLCPGRDRQASDMGGTRGPEPFGSRGLCRRSAPLSQRKAAKSRDPQGPEICRKTDSREALRPEKPHQKDPRSINRESRKRVRLQPHGSGQFFEATLFYDQPNTGKDSRTARVKT
jgi:hypothetical protein